jgi:hypothetical protein
MTARGTAAIDSAIAGWPRSGLRSAAGPTVPPKSPAAYFDDLLLRDIDLSRGDLDWLVDAQPALLRNEGRLLPPAILTPRSKVYGTGA